MAETERLKAALAGRYQVEHELGQGGMAMVYQARDVKHERVVAIKVLRPELAAVLGGERFLREIQIAAQLSHPHILPLYDSGQADSLLYYVMPYIEGESLRDRLVREKQLPIEEAVRLTEQVASALDYAHRNEIIHRDIKPENILIHEGQALVADFGIALAVRAAGGERLTETGLSLGTPHYMSPEQATGDRQLDVRSDIYSLGCVLYEMIAGEPPYTGPTAQAIIAKLLTERPTELRVLRETVPPGLVQAVSRAIARLPADRFATAAEFAEALTRPGVATGSVGVTGAAPGETVARRAIAIPLPSLKQALPWALFMLMGAAALWGWLKQAPPPHIARFQVGLPEETPLRSTTNGRTIALSPDGTRLVYVGPDRRLHVRPIDQLDARSLPGTEGAHTPFFSPDGEWIGFYSSPSLKKVALAGGPPLTIGSASVMRGASWGPDDFIVFSPTTSSGLLRISAAGGPVDTITRMDSAAAGVIGHRWPDILPGGTAALFTPYGGSTEESSISVVSLETGAVKQLMAGTDAHYVETGHIIYATDDGSLLAVPFDVDRLEVTGSPVSLLEGLMVKGTGVAEFTVSKNGTLAYLPGAASDMSLLAIDRRGTLRSLLAGLRNASGPRYSPDGRQVALRTVSEGAQDVWVYDIEQGTFSRLTFEGNNWYPTWTPDGKTITFSSVRGGADRDLYRRAADGSGAPQRILQRDSPQWEIEVAPDGALAVFREIDPTTGHNIWILPLEDEAEPTLYLQTPFNERSPVISPDGGWLAYTSNESGQEEVYVRAFPEPSGRWQVSTDGGSEPHWSPDGREIFYRSSDRFVSVKVETSPTFSLGQREELFDDRFARNSNHTNYDVHPSSTEFVILGIEEGAAPTLVVVLNWFEELRQRAGGGGSD